MTIKFIDLFAGIGGFHLAFHKLGATCVFACEKDQYARKTYIENFKHLSPEMFRNNMFAEDIREVTPSEIPDFDILCAGFPCQPFSQAGFKRGFDDNHKSERGNLFFYIVDIIEQKRPGAFFLENVRGIVNHDSGKTFKVIRNILENELGYSFYYKVVKASDYGLPQLRPRAFMIGFRDDDPIFQTFKFPEPIDKLKYTMSDIWSGSCTREIGYTLRVGGRNSGIHDRRNWDSYLVDNEVKVLTPKEGKLMQGFPKNFTFPVSDSQAMKQLGNSVAIDAIQACGSSLLHYMQTLSKTHEEMKQTKNKGEWSELYCLLKLLQEKQLTLAKSDLSTDTKSTVFNLMRASPTNTPTEYLIKDKSIIVKNEKTKTILDHNITPRIEALSLEKMIEEIKSSSGTFVVSNIEDIQNMLNISTFKGGKSSQKSDIQLDITNSLTTLKQEGFSIKSCLGGHSTLLNASTSTNFIYEIQSTSHINIDKINRISGRKKIKERLNEIQRQGGSLVFHKVEKKTMQYNLEAVDGDMPKLLGEMLLEFHENKTKLISKNLKAVYTKHYAGVEGKDLRILQVKIKRLLRLALLGFFPGKKWSGDCESKGLIVVKEDGSQVGLHILEQENLDKYLFNSIYFDSPSTTRHKYAHAYKEGTKTYFKLNLQLRFV